MNTNPDGVIVRRPILATVAVALVATVAYVGIQLVFDGRVAAAETGSFVLIFTIVYVAGGRFLADRARDAHDGDTPEVDATDADATE